MSPSARAGLWDVIRSPDESCNSDSDSYIPVALRLRVRLRLRSRLLASMPFQVFESEGTTELDVEGNVISEVPKP